MQLLMLEHLWKFIMQISNKAKTISIDLDYTKKLFVCCALLSCSMNECRKTKNSNFLQRNSNVYKIMWFIVSIDWCELLSSFF